MAEIKTNIDYDRDLTEHVVIGTLSSQELLGKLEAYHKGKATNKIIWNLMAARWDKHNREELMLTVLKAKKFNRKGCKTAMLFSNDLDYGIGRMIKANAEIMNYDIEFYICKDRDEAMIWLLG